MSYLNDVRNLIKQNERQLLKLQFKNVQDFGEDNFPSARLDQKK